MDYNYHNRGGFKPKGVRQWNYRSGYAVVSYTEAVPEDSFTFCGKDIPESRFNYYLKILGKYDET